MTTPGAENPFTYTDDSVIAKVSIDVPSQALTDITKLSEAMASMRTQLDAVAEAQAKWLGFLQQMSEATDDTSEAIKRQITQLERQSYLQGEGYGGRSGATAGGGGAGGYSTAAPAGYTPAWAPGTPGMGMGGGPGAGISPAAAAEKMEAIESRDPELGASMDSARGRAVNPATLGIVGAGVAHVMGKMKGGVGGRGDDKRDAARTPQGTSTGRNSSGAPNGDQGGVPEGSEDPASDAEPHESASRMQRVSYYLAKGQEIANEMDGGKGGRLASIAKGLGKASSIVGGVANGGSVTGAAKGLWGMLPGGVKAAGIAGAGLMAFNAAQNIGERVTEYQQLGSVQGGDWQTGMKYEAQARIMALNPFITTQQARQAMQMALKEGFRGDNYDTVQDFMIQNFKELGISMGQSMDIMKSQVKGMSEGDDMSGAGKDLEQTINTMKELSAEGGLSLPERINQLQDISEKMSDMGFSRENINRTALGLQEGYGDSMALRGEMGRIGGDVLANDSLITLAGMKAGITGSLPDATRVRLDEAGYDGDEIIEGAASMIAGYVNGFPKKIDRIANFKALMGQYGVPLTMPQAEDLYNKVTGEEKPTVKANRTIERQGKTQTGGGLASSGSGSASSSPMDSNWTRAHGNYSPSDNASGVSEDFDDAGRSAGNFAPSGNRPAPLPSVGSPPPSFSSNGTVTGTVTITVDQQGHVTAPASIQLTGQQQAALAGYGASQLNNAPPGDPNYDHSYRTFPSPGGA